MKKLILMICMLFSLYNYAQNEEKDKKDILKVLESQQLAWNNFDIEGFMAYYWKSDSLKFYGSNGVISGWENTLERYKKTYPTKNHSGILNFKINSISKISDDAYYVMGAYHLKRDNVGDANGIFMVIFKKINGEWKIIADTSC